MEETALAIDRQQENNKNYAVTGLLSMADGERYCWRW